MGRQADLRALPRVDKADRSATLLTVTAEDVGFQLRDLTAMQNDATAWIDLFVAEHGLTSITRDMLRALVTNYINTFGYIQVVLIAGEVDQDEADAMQEVADEVVSLSAYEMLDASTAEAFVAGLHQQWPTWVEAHLRR